MWVPQNYPPRGTMTDLYAAVKKAVSVPAIAVCSITPEMVEEDLTNNDADFIAMSRQTIADPVYPNKIRLGKPESTRLRLRCNECLGEVIRSKGISCAVDSEAGMGFESLTQIYPSSPKKNITIGGQQACRRPKPLFP